MNQNEYNRLFGEVATLEAQVSRATSTLNQREENLNKKQFLCTNSIPNNGIFLPPGDITRVNDTVWPYIFGTGRVDVPAGATVPSSFSVTQDGAFVIVEFTKVVFVKTLTPTVIPYPPTPAQPLLGAAEPFAILAGSTVTNTGPSVVTGDLGLSPGSSVVGFPPGTVVGTQHVGDANAIAAKAALVAAFLDLQGRTPTQVLTGINLGTLPPLAPGVYFFATSAQLTGNLVLDGQGNPNAVWVFQIGSTLTTAAASTVTMINSGQAGNVYWQVGSSATLGAGTSFLGDILAQASITLVTGANITGRLFAITAAVTLDTDAVVRAATPPPTPPLPGLPILGFDYLDPNFQNCAGQADGLTLMFRDAQSRRKFMDKPSSINHYGHPQYPTRFPRPMILNPNAMFEVDLVNSSTNDYVVFLAFNGYRLRLDNITRIPNG